MATVPNDLLDRIRALERKVRELTGRTATRPALNRIADGVVRVEQGGQLVVVPPGQNHATFTVGQWPDGSFGTVLRRMDGSYALTVEGEAEDRGTVRIWSRDLAEPDRILVMDDRHSPRHLGRPWLPLQLHPTADQRTTNTTWAHAWVGITPVHNAVAHIEVTSHAEAGGHVRLRIRTKGGEATVVDEWKVPAGRWTTRAITQPLHGSAFLDPIALQIEHHSSSRRKAIETRLLTAYSRNTLSASETPNPPAGRESDTGRPDPTLPAETKDNDQNNDQ